MTLHRTATTRQARPEVPPECVPNPPGSAQSTDGAHHPGHRSPRPDAADGRPSVQEVMHARLAAMAQPRPEDNPSRARLREVLRDKRIMAYVIANIDQWPPITDEQRAALAALLHQPRRDRKP